MGSQVASVFVQNIRRILNDSIDGDRLTQPAAGGKYLNSDILIALNQAKNKCADLLRRDREDYFLVTNVALNITVGGTKEYTLASDFRQLRNIKCVTAGYEDLVFREVKESGVEWQRRDAAPQSSNVDLGEFIYCIVKINTIKFADFSQVALTLNYDYIQQVADFPLDSVTTIPIPDEQNPFIEAYAAYILLLPTPDDKKLAEVKEQFRMLKPEVMIDTSNRQIRDAEYVSEYDPDS